jgi:small-conductance mechanosensitive channel
MTRADWLTLVKVGVIAIAIFYFRVWHLESSREGSWRAGHASLWKKPKKWQLLSFCVLWGIILIALFILFFMHKFN